MIKHKINFFWSGNGFDLIHASTIISHLQVNHDVVIWLKGSIPKSKYWYDEFNELIKNADDIFNIDHFIKQGGNIKTASALWRFKFLYEFGGIYCDCDTIALNQFPDDDWIIVNCERPELNLASIGVIKMPPKQEFLLDAINNIKHKWGNVKVFSKSYKKYFGKLESTHDDKLFYPFRFYEHTNIYENLSIPNAYSLHCCHTFLDRQGIFVDKDYILKYPKSLLYNLITSIYNESDIFELN